jgi:hypothetical protein
VNKLETAVPGGSPVKAHLGLTGRIAGAGEEKPWWGVWKTQDCAMK